MNENYEFDESPLLYLFYLVSSAITFSLAIINLLLSAFVICFHGNDTGIPAISLGDGGLFSTFGFSTFFSSLSGVFFLYLPSDGESLLYLSSGVLECLRLS